MRYNAEHGIEPKSVRKAISSIMDEISAGEEGGGDAGTAAALADEVAALGREEVLRMLAALEEQMAEASEGLDFEQAARLRDQAVALRAKVDKTDEEDALARLKSTARRGSTLGTRKNMGRRKRR